MFIEYNPNYHTPGKNILLLRKQYALSYRALAKLLDIDIPYLKELESGKNPPVLEDTLLIRLMQIFPMPDGKDILSPDLFD